MPLSFAHGAIQWLNADTVGTNYVINTLSFQPKALRFYWTGIQSATDATDTVSHLNRGMGFAVSTSSRRCVGTFNPNAADLPDCGTIARNDAVACTVAGDGTSGGQLDLTALAANGFTIRVDVATISADITVFWEAWGGDDITVAAVGDIPEPSSISAQNYSVTGFTLDATDQVVMISGCQSMSALNTGEGESTGFCAGFATAVGEQVVVCANSDDDSATTDTDHYEQSGQCLAMISKGGGSPNAVAALSAYGADQFTLNWTDRSNTNRRYIYMAIKGGQWRAGEYIIDTTVISNTADVAGLPFTPLGISVIGAQGPENAPGAGGLLDHTCFGSGIDQNQRQSLVVRDNNAVADVEIRHAIEYDQIRATLNADGTIGSKQDIASINSDGFSMVIDVADATGSTTQWNGYLTFGSASVGGSTITPHYRYYEMMRVA